MVYEVLIHVVSVEDTRTLGTDGRPLFYPFHFYLGAQDADQAVAPTPEPRDHGGDPAVKPPMNRALARHSYSAEYCRTSHHYDEDGDGEADGRGRRAFMPQHRSLFLRLRWPADKHRSRERSPRRGHGESSRHGGWRHGANRSPIPTARHMHECSLDRFLRHFQKIDKKEAVRKTNPAANCKPASPKPSDSSGSGSLGTVVSPQLQPIIEVDTTSWLDRPNFLCTPQPDPMLQEASMVNNNLHLLLQESDNATASQEYDWGKEMIDMESVAFRATHSQVVQKPLAQEEQGQATHDVPASQVPLQTN
jgi:hypothetical protein